MIRKHVAINVTFLVILASLAMVALSAHADRPTRARIAPVPVSEWTDAEREALGTTARGDQTIDIFKTCLRNLSLCRSWMPFTRYILSTDNGMKSREKELLILRTSVLCNADYDWAHHLPAAKRAGVSDEEILRIVKGPDAAGWNVMDAALLRAADELHRDSHVSDKTWASLKQRYNDSEMMDLVFTVGQYTMVSMFANSAGLQLEAGLKGIPK